MFQGAITKSRAYVIAPRAHGKMHSNLTTCFHHTAVTCYFNPIYISIYLLFLISYNENRAGCEADVTAASLASFTLILLAETVEISSNKVSVQDIK